jgi:hypothetical protein
MKRRRQTTAAHWLAAAIATLGAIGDGTPARAVPPSAADAPLPDRVRFNRDVRPILSDKCLFCHGFDKDKRKADLRLDTPEGLFGRRKHGPPVVPGKPAESPLVARVASKDPDEVMPPADHPKRLSARDVAVLSRWVEQGGQYEGHWAYLPPSRPAVPTADDSGRPGFVRNAIDAFVLQRLSAEALSPSPEADKATLLRRVTFDLTGLPPTAEEVAAFAGDRSPDAYEKVVDRLLASPRFGERMAMYWLDLVRYADTVGYHSDVPMNVSPYRQWVIDAFNANEPFDRFTIEQLAGDLLSDAAKTDPAKPTQTTAQRVASGYNRLLQTTEEGGAQAREYVVKNYTDRVRNYSAVWLGATMGCAQCHDHKFDPLSQRDFYNMAAFFADVQEATIGRREPGMPVPSASQQRQLDALDARIARHKSAIDRQTPELAAAQAAWERTLTAGGFKVEWRPVEVADLSAKQGTQLTKGDDGVVRAGLPAKGSAFPAVETYTVTFALPAAGTTAVRLEVLPDPSLPAGGPGVAANGNFVLTAVTAAVGDAKADRKSRRAVKIVRATADFEQDGFPAAAVLDAKKATGWAVQPAFGKPHDLVLEFDAPLVTAADDRIVLTLDFGSQYVGHQIGRFRLSTTTSAAPGGERSVPKDVRAALAAKPAKRSDSQRSAVSAFYRSVSPLLQGERDALAAAEREKADLLKAVPTCLVSTAGPPRVVKVLKRGDWQDDAGEIASPQVPAVLGPLPTPDGKRLTRLDLARWTVAKENPLTARVFVNRAWKLFFGQGLSKVLDDLGFQGEWPTHPELLDWLAVEFRDGGETSAVNGTGGGSGARHPWDVKRLVRLLVTSGTYRRSSTPTPAMKDRDPLNRLYARQSRFRLDAETVRDNALAVSGLLVEKVGGPSVFPYQPAGYWFALNFPTREWQNDAGDGLYRRGLYTHWQRSFLHPSLLAFDAPSREEGVCERNRSNIPQQALVLLNDPTYVEAARALAAKVVGRGGDDAVKIAWALEQVTNRAATNPEIDVLIGLLQKHRKEYTSDPAAAKQLLAVGTVANPKDSDVGELAAWTSVCRVLLNLSETITRY